MAVIVEMLFAVASIVDVAERLDDVVVAVAVSFVEYNYDDSNRNPYFLENRYFASYLSCCCSSRFLSVTVWLQTPPSKRNYHSVCNSYPLGHSRY